MTSVVNLKGKVQSMAAGREHSIIVTRFQGRKKEMRYGGILEDGDIHLQDYVHPLIVSI